MGQDIHLLNVPNSNVPASFSAILVSVMTRRSVGWSTTPSTLEYYPGSPAIGQKMLRPQDEHVMTDLYVADMQGINEKNSSFYQQDAFDFDVSVPLYLGKNRAGSGEPGTKHLVVLIDPSYDTDSDYSLGRQLMDHILTERPRACVMMFVPIVVKSQYKFSIAKGFKEMATKKCKIGQYNAMLTVGTANNVTKHEGSIMLVANPTKNFDDFISDDTLDYVSKLTVQGKGEFSVEQRMKKPKAKPVDDDE
jgi:23S rRNA A2030 N6-methylase RlmJ